VAYGRGFVDGIGAVEGTTVAVSAAPRVDAGKSLRAKR